MSKKYIKYTSETFREKMSIISPTLDFSKSVFVHQRVNIRYTCPIHGEKESLPCNLLKGHGCIRCGFDNKALLLSPTKQLQKCINAHGYKYDYSCTDFTIPIYKHNIINCYTHGKFKQTLDNHVRGKGCPQCYKEKRKDGSGWSKTAWMLAAQKSKNFDSYKLYIIECYNQDCTEKFIKVGITYHTIKNRFNGKSALPYFYKIALVISSANHDYIFSLESKLKREFKSYKYIPILKFGGSQECFNHELIRDIKLTSLNYFINNE